MTAASIAAIIALTIAVWVAFRFVPRLASNVEWDWFPFLTKYHVTREGWIYFFCRARRGLCCDQYEQQSPLHGLIRVDGCAAGFRLPFGRQLSLA